MTKRNKQLTKLVRQGDEQTCLIEKNLGINRKRY